MDKENLNPQPPREEPELITDVISKPKEVAVPLSDETMELNLSQEASGEAEQPATSKEDDWLEEFFRDFSLPEDDLPAKDPILKENWDPKPAYQAPAGQDMVIETEDEQDDYEPEPQGRPAADKNRGLWGILHSIPHLLVSLIWLALVVVIGVSLGRLIWSASSDLLAFGKEDQIVTITITDKEAKRAPDGTLISVDIEAIAQKLADAGLIEKPDLFVTFATLTGKDQDIAAGTYNLNTYFDYNAIINAISYHTPKREIVTVLIPEGYTCAQIFAVLAENEVCDVAELEDYAANGELDEYWFLEGVKRGSKYCLEGYLFPDTYDFYKNDDPGRVIDKFLANFDYRFSDTMRDDFAKMQERYAKMLTSHGYGSEYIANNPLTMHQLVTLASIVEKESGNGSESFDIASVYYNRLTNQKEYPYLDADATVHYAIGDYFGEIKELTQAHLNTDSPYNTRGVQKGLPPGPIANPGIYSLYAVLDPNETSYHYYALDPEAGTHKFAKTYSEFQRLLKELGYTS